MTNYTYKDLHLFEQMLKELKQKNPDMDITQFDKIVIEKKRTIRRLNKIEDCGSTIVRDDGIDGYVVKFPLPESIDNAEDADEYFREYEYIHYRPTYYDCTGQAFTSWYKIFRKPDGRFWAYHSVSLDV